jgi:hypothetical protein
VAIVPRRSQESGESPQGPEAVPQAEPAEVPAVPDSDAEAPTGPAVLGLVPPMRLRSGASPMCPQHT